MVYFSACLWLIVVLLLARGVLALWSSMVKAKTLSVALLPGTLVAHVGRIIALLITGATLPETPKGAPPGEVEPQPKMPVAGPIIVALVPMVLLAILLFMLIERMGQPVLRQIPADKIARDVPMHIAGYWEQLRALLTLSEKTLDSLFAAEAATWQLTLFSYLMICLTVRLAPRPGNMRGHLIAVAGLCGVAVLAGTLTPRVEEMIAACWPLLTLVVGWLLLLLLGSLLARAIVLTARHVIKWE